VRQAFAHRELLKVRVLESAPEETRDAAHALAAGVKGAAVVQVVGRSVTLYCPHPTAPEIRLPA
jgi:RNA-binding protein YhbY